VLELLKLSTDYPQGLTDAQFDEIFTTDKPVLFNFHGYENLIYSLVYNRHNKNFIVSGYQEEGTITTPFDMRVRNKIDRYSLMISLAEHLKLHPSTKKKIIAEMQEKLARHKEYICEYGVDMPEINDWKWQ
jgi:xylulose-5-phosphate/fructose-6-phosphate phosphoketolase